MTSRQHSAGAMPVVESATLSQSYPFGPWFAPYRVPRPGTSGLVDPRAVGILFEGEGAGSAGSAGGASGGQSDSGSAGSSGDAGGTQGGSTGGDAGPATGDAALGEAGKRALEAERTARKAAEDRAKAAEKERDEAKLANASDHDRAIAAAKAEGEATVTDRLHAAVRRQSVREALLAAGVAAGLVADLSKADEFVGLKVGDDDEIDSKELAAAVKAHKDRVPDAYKAPGSSGSADGGARGGDRAPATTLEDSIMRHYSDQERRQQRV